MNNDNQFTFEEDITLDSSVNNNPEPTPEEMRKKVLPALIIVIVLLVGSIAFAVYYFTKDNRDKLICAGNYQSAEVTMYLYYNETDEIEEMKVEIKQYFKTNAQREIYLASKKNGSSFCDSYKKQFNASYCKEKNDNKSVTLTMGLKGKEHFTEDFKGKTVEEIKEMVQQSMGLQCELNKKPKIAKQKEEKEEQGSSFVDSANQKMIDSINSFVVAVKIAVNANEFGPLSNTEELYYIQVDYENKKSCVGLEKGGNDPFGYYEKAYVVVHYNPDYYSYEYYFTYFDSAGYGLPLTKADNIKKSSIQKNDTLTEENIIEQTKVDGKEIVSSTGEPVKIVVISPETNCLKPNE